jgi:hypothetical protein
MQLALKETTDCTASSGFIGIQSEGSDIEIRKIIYELAEMERRSPYPRELHGCHVRAAAVFGPPVVLRSYVLCFVSETI